MRIEMFLLNQQLNKQKQEEIAAPTRGIALVMEKEESKPKKKTLMKIKIKKREEDNAEQHEEMTKVRVL